MTIDAREVRNVIAQVQAGPLHDGFIRITDTGLLEILDRLEDAERVIADLLEACSDTSICWPGEVDAPLDKARAYHAKHHP